MPLPKPSAPKQTAPNCENHIPSVPQYRVLCRPCQASGVQTERRGSARYQIRSAFCRHKGWANTTQNCRFALYYGEWLGLNNPQAYQNHRRIEFRNNLKIKENNIDFGIAPKAVYHYTKAVQARK